MAPKFSRNELSIDPRLLEPSIGREDAAFHFINKIDCNLPYLSPRLCYKLIDEALALSPEAVYYMMREICSPGSVLWRRKAKPYLLRSLLLYLDERFQHPLKDMMVAVGKKMVRGKQLPVAEVIQKMELLRPYKDMYGAMQIFYNACDDKYGEMEEVFDSILAEWAKEG